MLLASELFLHTATEEELEKVVFPGGGNHKKEVKLQNLLKLKCRRRCCDEYCWLDVSRHLARDMKAFCKLASDIHRIKEEPNHQKAKSIAEWFDPTIGKFVLDLGEAQFEVCSKALYHFVPLKECVKKLMNIALIKRDDVNISTNNKKLFAFFEVTENRLRKKHNVPEPNKLVLTYESKRDTYEKFKRGFKDTEVGFAKFKDFWLMRFPNLCSGGDHILNNNNKSSAPETITSSDGKNDDGLNNNPSDISDNNIIHGTDGVPLATDENVVEATTPVSGNKTPTPCVSIDETTTGEKQQQPPPPPVLGGDSTGSAIIATSSIAVNTADACEEEEDDNNTKKKGNENDIDRSSTIAAAAKKKDSSAVAAAEALVALATAAPAAKGEDNKKPCATTQAQTTWCTVWVG